MLRDYQISISNEAVKALQAYGLVYLAMQVRTGKTLTALATAEIYGAKKVLFLTKKKAIGSIQNDFTALKPSFDLYVTNHENVHTIDADLFDLVIIDEAHSLGQYPLMGSRTKTIKKICVGKPVIYLSGSPTPESYSQLFHQLHCSSFSPFKEYKSFYGWAKHFVHVTQRRFSQGLVNDYGNANKELIDQHTKHLFISYTQEAAGFTQSVQENILRVQMQKKTYDLAAVLRSRRVYVSDKTKQEVIADTEVKLMQKLHQVYSGSVLTESGEGVCFDNSKAAFIAKRFAQKKIAVFYKFKAEAQMLKAAFNGAVTESPEEFNRCQHLTFISQIQSGREGINLSSADALVMFNIDFSHVSYIQARARLQTQERQAACLLYWIFAVDGIEEKIYEKVRAKQDYQLSYFKEDFKIEKLNIAA